MSLIAESPAPARKPRGAPAAPTSVALYPMSAYAQSQQPRAQFHVIRFEDGQTDQTNRFVPHRHDFFEIIWLRSATGQVRSDLRSYPVRPRTLFFTSPGQVHAWELAGEANGEIASFREEFFAVSSDHPGLLAKMPFLYAGAADPILHLGAREGRRIDRAFRELHAAADSVAPGRDDLVRAYLTIVLTLARQFFLARKPDGAPAPAVDLLARRFRHALEENFPRLLEVSDYAELLRVSRTHLNAHLQTETGQSASDIIHERVVLEAKRLLSHTSLTGAQIAHRLRFQDPSYFARFFRRHTGQTPGAYRDQAQNGSLAG